MPRLVASRFVPLLLFALLAACQQPARMADSPRPQGWDALVDEYIEASFAATPPLAVRASASS